MTSIYKLPLIYMLLLCMLIAPANGQASTMSVGVNYGQSGNNLPQPAQVASLLQSMKISRVRILDADPDVLRAFAYTGISLIITLPNGFIPRLASNRTESLRWLNRHVKPFFPHTRITTISVGNQVLSLAPELAEFLLPAMHNLHLAINELGLGAAIKVTTTHSLDVLSAAFPPSAAKFQDAIADTIVKHLLDFLVATNGSFLVNVYPYLVYKSEPTVTLGYALFEEGFHNFREDPANGLRYRNLFDCLVDAVAGAMSALGYENIPVVVTETGWPSNGDPNEPDASQENAALYNYRLVRHVLSSVLPGTPLRRRGHVETYIFALFDENMRRGPLSEQHWGILTPDMITKYPLHLSASPYGHPFHYFHFYLTGLLCFFVL